VDRARVRRQPDHDLAAPESPWADVNVLHVTFPVKQQKEVSVTLASVQISLYPSLAFADRSDLPPVPALYFVLSDRREVVYIGQTANLRERWKSHHRARQMTLGAYRVHWKEIADEDQRLAAEKAAIEYFRPLWNRTEVPVADIKRVEAYINDVARYMEIDPRELVCKILMEWAYGRVFTRKDG
jgi:hypothetical protein